MKLIFISFCFLFISLLSFTLSSKTIAIVDIQSLIDNNSSYINIIEEVKIQQLKYVEKFQLEEQKLKNSLKEIEDESHILNENEINLKLSEYNNNLENFTLTVEDYNYHYQNQIILIRESVLKEIIVLLEKYATDNKIDLIFDSTSYLIASNNLDITDEIKKELEKINIILEFTNFEED